MKKKIIVGSIIGIILIISMMIGKYVYPRLLLKNAISKLSNISSISISGSIDVKWRNEKITITGYGDIDDRKGSFSLRTNILFIPISLKLYTLQRDENIYFYSQLDNDKTLEETKIIKEEKNTPSIRYRDIQLQILDYQQDFVHAKVKLNTAFQELLNPYGVRIVQEGELELWVQEGYLSRIKMNSGELCITTSKEIPILNFDLTLTNYNRSLEIEMPSEVNQYLTFL